MTSLSLEPTVQQDPSLKGTAELGDKEREEAEVMFSEGGGQAWMTVFGAALASYASFGYTNAFGVYQGDYPQCPSNIGWIGGVQIFLIFTFGIITGRAFDQGYFHHMMISGSILHSLSFFMLSLSHQNKYYQVFLSQGLGGGMSVGLMYTPLLSVVSHHFRRKLPLATGIVTAGTALGAVLHPIMLNRLFESSLGFHNGVRVATAITSFLLLVSNFMMTTRLPPSKSKVIPLASFARDPPYVFVILGGLLIISGFSFPVFFLQLYGSVHGLSDKLSPYILSILNACSVIGRLVPPAFAPKFGVVNLVIFFTFCMAVLEYCLLVVSNSSGFIAFAVIYGFCSGAGVALTPAMLALLAKDVDEVGARIGVSFAISGVVGLFGNVIFGALLTRQYHWPRPIILAATVVFAGGVCYVVARFLLVKRCQSQIV